MKTCIETESLQKLKITKFFDHLQIAIYYKAEFYNHLYCFFLFNEELIK